MIVGFLPGSFIGVLIEIVRIVISEFNRLAALHAKFEIALRHLNDKTEFNNFRETLLDCDPRYSTLMRELVHESSIANIRHIPHVSYDEFYARLVSALRVSSIWEGVHQQVPELLGLVTDERDSDGHFTTRAMAARKYFDALREHCNRGGTRRRRIIILKEEDFRNFLANKNNVYTTFWKWNGDSVENYLIRQKTAQEIAMPIVIDQLDDCAINNQQMFLHYEREKHTLLFDHRNDGAEFSEDIARAVERLFHALDNDAGDFLRLHKDSYTTTQR
jgi:hypothetical protein